MNLLFLLLPIWVLSSTLLSAPIDVGSNPPVSAISEPVVPTDKEPISQISSDAEPHSPGTPEIKVVHHHDLDKRILIALIVASSLFGGILLLLSCFWVCRLHKIKNSNTKGQKCLEDPKLLSPVPILGKFNSLKANVKKGSAAVIDYQKLLAATNNFKEENIVGEGGIGRVYKAQFDDNSFAAVKRLNGGGQDAERQFEKELNWLNKIQHQNIVSLLGYCVRGETMLLVYEMMHNGSLESQLHGPSHGSALTWHLRMKIALDIARGLEFLHERCNPPVIHRDLKSSNILLDCDFNAKLSDFGLAISGGAHSKNNLKLSGTLGYVAPEYLLDGKLTDKSDVYAFGVILLELLTGKKAVEKIEPSQCQSIVSWAMPQLTDRSKLSNIVDPAIRNTMDLKHLYQVAAVAVLCIQPEPSYRPLITDVLHSFIPLVPVELGGSLRVSEAVISGRS